MKKKIISVLLLATMILGLAACGKTETKEEAPAEESKVEESAEEEAPAEEERELVTIKIITRSNNDQPGAEEMEAALNEYLIEKLNTQIEWVVVATDFDTQITPMIAGEWDIIQGLGGVQFTTAAQSNALLDLTPYMGEYLQAAQETVRAEFWTAFAFDGKQFGIPPWKDLAANWGYLANQTLIDECGLTVPELDTYWDLLPFFKELKAKRDELYPDLKDTPICGAMNLGFMDAFYYFDNLLNQYAVTNLSGLKGFANIPDDKTVFNVYEQPEFLEVCLAMNEMQSTGVFADEKEFDTDKILMQKGYLAGGYPMGYIEIDPGMNDPYYTTALYTAKGSVTSTGYVLSGGTVINASCKYPERALEVIDMFYGDEYASTVAHFGVEGKDWTDENNDHIIELGERNADPASRYWYQWYGWWIGSLTATKWIPGTSTEFGAKVDALNNNATVSPCLGFVVDQTPITNEVAACNNIKSEYISQLSYQGGKSAADIEKLVAEFNEKLKANGIDTIIAEVQSQLDAWYAAQ